MMVKDHFKRVKSFLSLLIVFGLLVGAFPLSAFAAEQDLAQLGDYYAILDADPDTSVPPPGFFGVPSSDGRVWSDKSVNTRSDGNFDHTLTAVGQEFMASTESIRQGPPTAADVVLVLDLSLSMDGTDVAQEDGGNIRRVDAMIQAANQSIHTILSANPHNRVSVVGYRATGTSGTNVITDSILPLDSYSFEDSSRTDYLRVLTTGGGSGTRNINVGNGLLDGHGSSYTISNIPIGTYTPTQTGIYAGVNSLINAINSESFTVERLPFVLMLTDGAANRAYPNWLTPTGGGAGGTLISGDTEGSAQIAALTNLTASYMKDQLTEAYQAYNESNPAEEPGFESDVEAIWFNVGLAVQEDNNYARALLDPQWTYEGVGSAAANTKSQIEDVITATPYAVTNGVTGYGDWDNYDYTDKTELPGGEIVRYLYFVNTTYALNRAFRDLASLIVQETTKVTPPLVSTDDAVGAESSGFAWIRDSLGDGMERKSGFSISFDGGITKIPFTEESAVPGGIRYSNTDYPGLDFVEVDGIITWHIRTDYMPLYKYIEVGNPAAGYTSPEPIRAYYEVGLTEAVLNDSNSDGKYFWTNLFDQDHVGTDDIGSSYGMLPPRLDNPYYYHTNLRVGLIGAPFLVGLNETNFEQYVQGTPVGNVNEGDVLTNLYISPPMLWVEDSPVAAYDVGQVVPSLTVTPAMAASAEFMLALGNTLKDCTSLTSAGQINSASQNYAFKAGILLFETQKVVKERNNTDSLQNVSIVVFDGDNPITRNYGNNGRILLFAENPIEKEVDKEAVKVGENVTYLIHVKNPTNEAMADITVSDTIADGLSIVEISDSGSAVGNFITWNGIDLAAGATKTLTVVATATALASEEVTNAAEFMWLDRTIESNVVTTTVETPEDSLSISKAVDKEAALAGDELNYTLTVENESSLAWTNIEVTDTLPLGLTLVPGSISSAGTYDAVTRTVTWTIPSLAAGANVGLSFKALIPEDVEGDEVYKNTGVIIKADDIDVNIPSNEVETTVTPKPDPEGIIDISKLVDKDVAEPGEELSYEIRIENTSDVWSWNNVVITDQIDEGLTLVPDSISHGGVLSGDTITWTLPTLGAEDEVTLSFKVTVPDVKTDTWFRNTAVITSIDDEDTDIPSIEVETFVEPRLVPEDALSIWKAVDKTSVRPGGELNYTVYVQNETTKTLTALNVRDEIRTGITVDESSISHGGVVAGGFIEWLIATLNPSEQLELTFKATAPTANEEATLLNTAVITSVEQTETDIPSNETTTTVIPFDDPEDVITIKKSVNLEVAHPGDQIDYTVTVENASEHENFSDVVVSDTLPEGLELVDGSISHGGVVSEGKIRWTIATLAAGDSVNLTFSMTVPDDLDVDTEYANVAAVISADGEDIDIPSNEVVTIVEASPDPAPGPDPDDDPAPDDDDLDTVIVTRTGDDSADAAPLWLAGLGIGLAGLGVALRRLRKHVEN